jgi:FKBP-type peptidyl-prolyl cis-trans isomerase (trigger factor)
MSDSAMEFLQDWLEENVHVPTPPVKLEKEAEILARECKQEAADAGVPLEDIEEEVGNLKELLVAKLQDAAERGGKP